MNRSRQPHTHPTAKVQGTNRPKSMTGYKGLDDYNDNFFPKHVKDLTIEYGDLMDNGGTSIRQNGSYKVGK